LRSDGQRQIVVGDEHFEHGSDSRRDDNDRRSGHQQRSFAELEIADFRDTAGRENVRRDDTAKSGPEKRVLG